MIIILLKTYLSNTIRSNKHFSEFYPQHGGENQLGTKLRHCHPMYRVDQKGATDS